MVRWLEDALLLGRIAVFAALVPLLMRLPVRSVGRFVEPRRAPLHVRAGQEQRIVRFVELALRGGRPIIRSSCLTRGLTRYYFLRRAGVDVSLVFGVGRPTVGFSGHCWLVKDGVPHLESQDPRDIFTETYRISPVLGLS